MKWFASGLFVSMLCACVSSPDTAWRRSDNVPLPPADLSRRAALVTCTTAAEKEYPRKISDLPSNVLREHADQFNRMVLITKCMALKGFVPAS